MEQEDVKVVEIPNNSFKTKGYAFIFGRIFNAVFFYVGWLICMQQAPGNYPYLGPLLIAGILAYHLYWTYVRKVDLILIGALALIGTIVDTAYIQVGMIQFKGGYSAFPHIAPLWITSLWALYAISINHSLAWLSCNIGVAALMGAGGAISSYLVGIKLGAADFLWPEIYCLIVIGCVWAVVVPASLRFSDWLKGSDVC